MDQDLYDRATAHAEKEMPQVKNPLPALIRTALMYWIEHRERELEILRELTPTTLV